MTLSQRRAVAAVVLIFVIVGLIKFFIERPSWSPPLMALFWILIWTPPKGALIRFMGGRRPNWSALACNASSDLQALGFPLASLGFPWPAIWVNLLICIVVESLVLMAMATGRVKACLIMSIYVNIFAHVVVYGGYLFTVNWLGGAAVIVVGFLLFIVPIFVQIVPDSEN